MGLTIDLSKAKDIAHEKRRAARSAEFAPFDEVIMKQIPGNDLTEAENERQRIRDKYAAIQVEIESANTVGRVTELYNSMVVVLRD